MFKQVIAVVAIASMVIVGQANANAARVAAEEAVTIASKTQAGRNLFGKLGIEIPANLGSLSKIQRGQLEAQVAKQIGAKPKLSEVLTALKAANSSANAESAATAVISFNPVSAAIVSQQSKGSKSLVNQAVASQEVAQGQSCKAAVAIPSEVSGIFVGFKDCGLKVESQQAMVEIAKQVRAKGGTAQNLVQVLAARNGTSVAEATVGARTLATKCVMFSNNMNSQIQAL